MIVTVLAYDIRIKADSFQIGIAFTKSPSVIWDSCCVLSVESC